MKNFWANKNPAGGSLFGKKSGLSAVAGPLGTTTPPPKGLSSSHLSSAPTPPPAVSDSAAGRVKFDHDFACGVFVGAFAIPGMVVSLDVVEVTDPVSKRIERTDHWLRTNDMLAILTREYAKAQDKLSAAAGPARDDATRRLSDIRDQVVCVLHSRRAYHRAKEAGIRVLIEA